VCILYSIVDLHYITAASTDQSTTLELKTVTKLDENSIRDSENSIDTYDVKVELDCTSVNEASIDSDDTNKPDVAEDNRINVGKESSTVDTIHETNGGITDDNIVHETMGTANHDIRVRKTNGMIAFGVKVEGSTAEVIDLPEHYPSGQDIYNKCYNIVIFIPNRNFIRGCRGCYTITQRNYNTSRIRYIDVVLNFIQVKQPCCIKYSCKSTVYTYIINVFLYKNCV